MTQLGVINFSPKFHNALANFNQHINRILDTERLIEQLCFNNLDSALLIEEKIDREEITERTKFCAYYAEKGKGAWVEKNGKKAEAGEEQGFSRFALNAGMRFCKRGKKRQGKSSRKVRYC